MIAAALAGHGGGLLHKVLQLLHGKERTDRPVAAAAAPVQGRPVGTHQAGNIRTDDFHTHFLFKGPQHSFVVERAALHDDPASEFFRTGAADNLVERVFDNGYGKPGTDVLHGSAVFLGLFDRGIHEDRAA